MDLVPYAPEHLLALDIQPDQRDLATGLDAANAAGLVGPHSVTLLRDGRPLACGGVADYWPGRGYAWLFIGAAVRGHVAVAATLRCRRWLDALPHRRLEAAQDVRYPAHGFWLERLGFRRETARFSPMRAFYGDRDFHLYARVKEG